MHLIQVLLFCILSGAAWATPILDHLKCEPEGTYIIRDLSDCGALMHCHQGKRDVMVCSPDTHYSIALGEALFLCNFLALTKI